MERTQTVVVGFVWVMLAACSGDDARFDPEMGLPLCVDAPTPPSVLPGSATVVTVPLTIEVQTGKRDALLFHPSGAAHVPVVLFINGGSIDGHRYGWLGSLLAGNGYAAVIVQENGAGTTSRIHWPGAMIDRLRKADVAPLVDLQRVILAGHSFGGAVVLCLLDQKACMWTAGKIALAHGIQGAFVLSARFQPPDDPKTTAPIALAGVPVMIVSGTADKYMDPTEVAATFSRLSGAEHFLVQLDGVNHYQATDCLEPESDNYRQDAPARIAHAVALKRFGDAILAFLSWKSGSDASAWSALKSREGITVTRAAH